MTLKICNTWRYTLIIMLVTSLAAGCAQVSKEKGRYQVLADIRLEKNSKDVSADCPINIRIANRSGVTWEGVSYNIAMLDGKGKTLGALIGSTHKHAGSGQDLADTGKVLRVSCASIAGASLAYLGYYPVGKKQESFHNSNVKVELR